MSVFTVSASTTGSVVSINVTPNNPAGTGAPTFYTDTITINNTGFDIGPSGDQYTYYFDGGILEANYSPTYDFGTNDFTVEFWMKLNTVDWPSQSSGAIIEQKNNDGTNGWTIYHNTMWSTPISARLTQSNDYNTTTQPSVGVWEHWALVRTGNTLTWYHNGTSDASYDITGLSPIQDTSAWLKMGQAQTWGGYLQGVEIHSMRIVNGRGLYTGNFTPSTSSLPLVTDTALLTAQTGVAEIFDTFSTPTTTFHWVRESLTGRIGGTTLEDNGTHMFSSYTNSDNGAIPVGKAYIYLDTYWTDLINFTSLVGTNVTFDDAGIGPQNPAEGNIDSWDGSTLIVSIVSGTFTSRTTLDKITYGY